MSADGVRDFDELRRAVDALQDAIDSIDRGMCWAETDEGGPFWGRQVENLQSLRDKLEDKIAEEEEDEEDEWEDDWEREWREFEQKGDGNG